MDKSIRFLLNLNTKTGIILSLEFSTLHKKDAINSYYENKMTLQFYSSNFFFLIYKKKRYNGVFLGIPFFKLIKIKVYEIFGSLGKINGIFLLYKDYPNPNSIFKLPIDNKRFKIGLEESIEIYTILYYLIDRKKKINYR